LTAGVFRRRLVERRRGQGALVQLLLNGGHLAGIEVQARLGFHGLGHTPGVGVVPQLRQGVGDRLRFLNGFRR